MAEGAGVLFRSGYVALLGKPNVGKSTLLNALLGEKIAIISAKPQTTRQRILGIKTTESVQYLFLDTPGIHKARSRLNEFMMQEALATLADADVGVLLVEPEPPSDLDRFVVAQLAGVRCALILAVNKMDTVTLEQVGQVAEAYRTLGPFREGIGISALHQVNLELLLERIAAYLPEGPKYYPDDVLTDQTERFIVGEMIREKIYELTKEEIPYASAVVVEEFTEHEDRDLVHIRAEVFVEKDSQKAIVIGEGGRMLREIGRRARAEIEAFLGRKVFLELWVKVQKHWTRDAAALRRLGYRLREGRQAS